MILVAGNNLIDWKVLDLKIQGFLRWQGSVYAGKDPMEKINSLGYSNHYFCVEGICSRNTSWKLVENELAEIHFFVACGWKAG